MSKVSKACIGLMSSTMMTSLLAPPTSAQEYLSDPLMPRQVQLVDGNGVDLSLDIYTFSDPDIGIGSSGLGLSHELMTKGSWFQINNLGMTDNLSIFLVDKTSCSSPSDDWICVEIDLGKSSTKFEDYGSQGFKRFYGPNHYGGEEPDRLTKSGSGSTATYTYIDKTGAIYTFNAVNSVAAQSTSNINHTIFSKGSVFLVSSIKYPNGKIVNFSYSFANNFARKQAVYTNSGYMLKYIYAQPMASAHSKADYASFNPVQIVSVNQAFDACSPAADTCSFTRAWPTVGYAYNAAAGTLKVTYPNQSYKIYTVDGNFVPTQAQIGSKVITITHNNTVSYGFEQQLTSLVNTVASIAISGSVWTYSATVTGTASEDYVYHKITVQDPLGNLGVMNTSYSNYANGTLYRWTPPGASSTPLGGTMTANASYDARGFYTGMTDYEGNGVGFGYNAREDVTTVTFRDKTLQSTYSLTYGYDATCLNIATCHEPNWFKDENGAETDYAYDSISGLVTSETRPAGPSGVRPQTRYTNSAFYAYTLTPSGSFAQAASPIYLPSVQSVCQTSASCSGTADETRTTFAYGSAGTANNLEKTAETVSSGDGGLSSPVKYVYDPFGDVVSIDGPLAGTADTTVRRYDASRLQIGEVLPDPDGSGPLPYRAARTTYDTANNPVLTEIGTVADQTDTGWSNFSAVQRSATAYNSRNLPIQQVTASGGTVYSVTSTDYNADGMVSCLTTRMNIANFPSLSASGAITGGSLPSSACTASTAGSYGGDRIETRAYDPQLHIIQIRRAVGSGQDEAYVTYSYTPNGKQQYVIDANGNRAQLTYDSFDREIGWYFPSATKPTAFNGTTQATALSTAGSVNTADFEAYGYDIKSNRIGLKKRDGRVICQPMDALNRVSAKFYLAAGAAVAQCATTSPTGAEAVFFGYDNSGHQLYARFTSATGQGITNSYDALGRETASTNNMGGFSRTLSYQYDAAGNRIRVTHPDGNYFTYVYDNMSRPTNILQSGSATIVTEKWDPIGRRAAETRGVASIGYGYDAISRLSSLSNDVAGTAQDITTSLTYSPASQIVTEARSNDAYAWSGAVNLTRAYSANGLNQYATIAGVAQAYDANGNMLSGGGVTYGYDVENRLVSASNGVSLVYDPLGRLFQISGGSAGTTQFLYDGDALVGEYNGSGGLLRRYVHGNDDDDPMIWYEGSGLADMRSLQIDRQGSIVSIANNTGTVSTVNAYDNYGIPNTANAGRFQYTGQAWIPELGMYYYKARIYSPTLGRFMQTDPIGYKDQINLYAYVANDPVDGVDPTGMDSRTVRYDPVTGTTTVTIPVIFTGSGSNANSLAEVQTIAGQLHAPAGESPISIDVVQAKNSKGDTQTVDLSSGRDFTAYNNGQGEGNNIGKRQIHIDSSRTDAAAATMHDLLHGGRHGKPGATDQYDVTSRDSNGHAAGSTPRPGFENNIMGTTTGREITNSQVRTQIGPVSKKID